MFCKKYKKISDISKTLKDFDGLGTLLDVFDTLNIFDLRIFVFSIRDISHQESKTKNILCLFIFHFSYSVL